ncbi:MAG TPA: hypothetical protein VHD32_18410 [Candidatus Didemnitutus sp.]|nr:hypothetical protein [Candidatus Didemnitutus sp.]
MRQFLPVLVFAAIAGTSFGQNANPPGSATPTDTPPPTAQAPASSFWPSFIAPIPGLFDINLPRLYAPGTFHLLLQPSGGDLFHHDFIRIPTGVRWTINDSLEVYGEAQAYVSNWFKGKDAGYGIGELDSGAKYILPDLLGPRNKLSLSFDTHIPVGSPPADLTDGLNHFAPAFEIEHHSSRQPRLTTFGGYGLDFVSKSFVTGEIARNEPHTNSMSFNGGATYDRGQLVWTFQSTYTTTALLNHHVIHVISVQPSVLWFVPKKYTLNSKTQWIIGLGVRGTWGPDGSDFATSSKLRADITFGQMIERLRSSMDFHP